LPISIPRELDFMSYVQRPKVRYMIVCDELLRDASRPGKPLIVGLTSSVRWRGDTEPTVLPKMTIFLVLTDGRGTGRGLIRCVNEVDGEEVFRSPEAALSFDGRDPIGIFGQEFRLTNCRFPEPDNYLMQFLFNDAVADERIITVR
jgi:hypothetical protein